MRSFFFVRLHILKHENNPFFFYTSPLSKTSYSYAVGLGLFPLRHRNRCTNGEKSGHCLFRTGRIAVASIRHRHFFDPVFTKSAAHCPAALIAFFLCMVSNRCAFWAFAVRPARVFHGVCNLFCRAMLALTRRLIHSVRLFSTDAYRASCLASLLYLLLRHFRRSVQHADSPRRARHQTPSLLAVVSLSAFYGDPCRLRI